MPRVRSKTPQASPSPWWLAEGDEECGVCGQLYVSEILVHCPDCDTPTCIHCRRRGADKKMICHPCSDENAGGGDTHGG